MYKEVTDAKLTRGYMMGESGLMEMSNVKKSGRKFLLLILSCTLILNLAIDGVIGWQLLHSRGQYERNAETDVENISKVLEQNVHSVIREIDLALQAVAYEYHRTEQQNKGVSSSLQQFIDVESSRLPSIVDLRLVNSEGDVVYATGEKSTEIINIMDRDHFRQTLDSDKLVIGEPVLGRNSHKWLLSLSRRIVSKDGTVKGQINASLEIGELTRMFSELDLGPHGVVSLWNKTTTLARHPEKVNEKSAIGLRSPSPQLKKLLDAEVESASYQATAPTDGVKKTYSIHRVGKYPLWVIAGLAETDYFEQWYRELNQTVFIAILFAVLSGLSVLQIYRYWSISQQHLRETVAREHDEQLKAAQALAHVGSWVKDLNNGTCIWSDEMFRILGYSPNEKLPDNSLLIASANTEDRGRLIEILKKMEFSTEILSYQYRINTPDSKLRWVHLEGRLETGSDSSYRRVTGFVRDITDSKLGEEERLNLERQVLHSQKLESIGVLTGGIAHDFNNLLTVIIGNLELCQDQITLVSPVNNYVEQALQSANRAAELTSQMLSYAGKGKFKLQEVDLNQLIMETATLLRTTVPRSINFTINSQPNTLPVKADLTQIHQVVMNLITNASEAIGPNPGSITLSTGTKECTADYLDKSCLEEKPLPGFYSYIEIHDTGIGMDKETISRIFEPFFTTKFTGRGLGMATIMGIVKAHHGVIIVDSEPGKGTKFTVLLPSLFNNESNVEETVENHEVMRKRFLGAGTVLAVDDEPTVRSICVNYLKMFGFEVLEASDGIEALSCFHEHSQEIVLVFLDITMPNMDGISVFNELVKLKPDIKVVICSGNDIEVAANDFYVNRPAAFIQKPYRLNRIEQILDEILPQV